MTLPDRNSVVSGTAPSIQEVEGAVYYLFLHRGWRTRQVERWSYGLDAQWSRQMTFDILIGGKIADVFDRASKTERDRGPRGYLIPLFELPKGTTFSSLDLRDQAGNPLKLYDGSKSSLFIVSALWGAMSEEPNLLGQIKNAGALRGFLHELFNLEFPLKDSGGKIIMPSDPEREASIKTHVIEMIGFLESMSAQDLSSFGWRKEDIVELAEDFSLAFDNSRRFRWFVEHYTYYQLYCTQIDGRDTVVKCSYQSSFDLFTRASFHHRCSPFCYFEAPLDASDMSDEGCVTVFAPEGMEFVPNFYPHGVGSQGSFLGELREAMKVMSPGKMRKAFGKRWLTIVNRLPSGEHDSPIGVGSLSPSTASFRDARHRWVVDEEGLRPSRRIPIDGDGLEHRYVLELMMLPKLGVRAACYFAVVCMCVALFAIPLFSHPSAAPSGLQTITSLAPLVTLLVSSMDGSRYIRREASMFPRYVAVFCAVASVLLLMVHTIMLSYVNGIAAAGMAVPQVLSLCVSAVLWTGFVISSLSFLLVSVWLAIVYGVRKSWSHQEEYYGSFDVAVE